jgi:hypothetical protein
MSRIERVRGVATKGVTPNLLDRLTGPVDAVQDTYLLVGEARPSADAADRSSAVLESLALDRGPQWQLEHLENDAFILTNIGQATVPRCAHQCRRPPDPWSERILPGSSIKFLALGSLSATNDNVMVNWSPDEERDVTKTWSRPIPGNPSR